MIGFSNRAILQQHFSSDQGDGRIRLEVFLTSTANGLT